MSPATPPVLDSALGVTAELRRLVGCTRLMLNTLNSLQALRSDYQDERRWIQVAINTLGLDLVQQLGCFANLLELSVRRLEGNP